MSRCLLALLVFFSSWSARAQAKEEKLCKSLFKQKRHLESARCFAALAESIPTAANAAQRLKKGRWLRNAAILMTRAARGEARIGPRSYRYELARKYVLIYLKQKLYETQHQHRLAKVRLAGIDAKIGYASLSITTGHLKSKISISGYKFQATGVGAWSQKVRPGSYAVRVNFPDAPVEIKAVKVALGESKLLSFKPPVSRPKPRRALSPRRRVAAARPKPLPAPKTSPVPLVLMIGGGVLVAGAVGALVGGALKMGEAQALCGGFAGGNCQPAQGAKASDYHAAYDASDALFLTGGLLAGAGVVLAGIGALLQLTAKPTRARTAIGSPGPTPLVATPRR